MYHSQNTLIGGDFAFRSGLYHIFSCIWRFYEGGRQLPWFTASLLHIIAHVWLLMAGLHAEHTRMWLARIVLKHSFRCCLYPKTNHFTKITFFFLVASIICGAKKKKKNKTKQPTMELQSSSAQRVRGARGVSLSLSLSQNISGASGPKRVGESLEK